MYKMVRCILNIRLIPPHSEGVTKLYIYNSYIPKIYKYVPINGQFLEGVLVALALADQTALVHTTSFTQQDVKVFGVYHATALPISSRETLES